MTALKSKRNIQGVIINRDLTNLGKDWQWSKAQKLIKESLRVFPSLGNHDYKNQFNSAGCNGWEGCFPNAARMVNAMRDWLDNQWNMKQPVTLNKAPLVFSEADAKMCGSLAYSFDIGKIHVLQLQLHPKYTQNWADKAVTTQDTHGHTGITYSITESWDFMKKDLETARNQGKTILVFLHSYFQSNDSMTEDEAKVFDSLMTKYDVSAIFAGHLHDSFGRITKNYPSTSVPLFRSGSADFQVYLVADIDISKKKMKVWLSEDIESLKATVTGADENVVGLMIDENAANFPSGRYNSDPKEGEANKVLEIDLNDTKPSTLMSDAPDPQLTCRCSRLLRVP